MSRPGAQRWVIGFVLTLTALGVSSAVAAQGVAAPTAIAASLQLRSDLVAVTAGGVQRGLRQVGTADLALDLDLQTALAWDGAIAHLDVLANDGGAPEVLAGSLAGVDNGEAGPAAVRLYQAWIETRAGGANLRVGLSDISAEFNVADASGLLMGSSFGVGAEMAGTETAAPSYYPSTALGVRLRADQAQTGYWQAAVINARPGTPGDREGLDLSFSRGVMAIAERGWTGQGKIAFGVWGYTRRQADLTAVNAQGEPRRRAHFGAYAVFESPLAAISTPKRTTTGFLKVGLSDGRANEVAASWQAGLLAAPALASRPDSAFSIAVAQALLSSGGRAGRRDAGLRPAAAENQLEITYSDRLTKTLALQPDLQIIQRRQALRAQPLVVVLSLRITAAF